ncbi:MAG: hypothetical protein Q7U98_20365 [Methylicorpusculum sp.]|uniref:hypothetical protein n=1 Tax=Methylicorpusculum sp. TaxID=2713644 RepID=UPI002717FDB0|nr:hypothetical protein [Methylicorpusculum sp.]MDO8941520.1 hypothetical protein [Methylicorpusculum sp.]
MDYSLISSAIASLRAAKDIGNAALELREWNLVVGEMTKINGELLKAYDALFTHSADLLDLQEKYAKAVNELRQANEVLAERGRYTLFEIGRGKLVYRFNVVQAESEGSEAVTHQPVHYLCQPCFDLGRKMVLQLYLDAADGPVAACPHCKQFFNAELVR